MDPVAIALSATSMLWKEVTLQPGVLRDLDFIGDELKIMPDLLAAAKEEKGDGNPLLRVWLKQFHAVSCEFEGYLQNFLVQQDNKSRWRIITLVLDQCRVARRVKALRIKVKALSQNLRSGTAPGSNPKPAASPNAAALSYVAYDEYVLLHGDSEVTHADDGIPLEQYKQNKKILVGYNKDSVEDGVPVLPVEALSQNLRSGTAPGSNPKPAASPNAAALSYVAYDEYVLLHGDSEVTHADDGIPLEQYKQNKKILVEYNKDSVEDGVPVLPGETDAFMVYQIASEQGKKIIRTILKSLRANERSSLCFTQFTESNILVSSSGKVKFRNVSVLRNLTGDDLLEQQRDNYLSAHKIIEDLFSGTPPLDIQHLLDLIKDDFGARELFHIHGSLASIAVYSTLFQYMYEHIRKTLPKEDMRAILDSLPYVDTWKTQIESNELLLIPFNYNPKSYQVPSDRPKQTCLNKDQMTALKGLGLTPQPRQPSLTTAQIKLIEARQFFEYLRNRTAHRMDPLEKRIEANRAANAQGSELVTANWAYNAQGSELVPANWAYDAQGSELVTYIRFPLIVPYMQVELYSRNQHRKIPMDKLF